VQREIRGQKFLCCQLERSTKALIL
jgi:hypothetical protein